MARERPKSIAEKLQSLVLSALFGALITVLGSTVVSDFFTYRESLVDKLSVVARTIGTNAAPAVRRQDAGFATNVLLTVADEENVLRALIVLRDGNVLAEYSVGDHSATGTRWVPPFFLEGLQDVRVTFHLDYIELLAPIQDRGEYIGAILLNASPAGLYQKLFWKLLLTVVQLVAAVLLALLISARIKRQISQPILSLAAAMDRISAEQDYSVTVKKHEDDEIGSLVDGFNKMLEQIRFRDKRLAHLASRDPLTGCLNRRAFFDALEPLFAKARAEGRPIACIMGDIDHFKSINDRFGHQVGDETIRLVAEILAQNTRPEDLLCRYGGEEFCMALPGLSVVAANLVAERLRLGLELDAGLGRLSVESLAVTCSFGVADLSPQTESAEALIAHADKALYISKREGRNRVTAYAGTDEEPA